MCVKKKKKKKYPIGSIFFCFLNTCLQIIAANFKCPHWAVWYVWFIFFMIKVSDVLRAQPNCLWSITNYGSAGKRQANKYPLFHQEIKIQKVSYTVANPRQGVQLPSRTSAGEMTAGWPWGIHGGKNLAGLPEQKCLEEKRSTRTSHLIQPSGKERGRRTGRWWAGRGARSHRRWAWCHLKAQGFLSHSPAMPPSLPCQGFQEFPRTAQGLSWRVNLVFRVGWWEKHYQLGWRKGSVSHGWVWGSNSPSTEGPSSLPAHGGNPHQIHNTWCSQLWGCDCLPAVSVFRCLQRLHPSRK